MAFHPQQLQFHVMNLALLLIAASTSALAAIPPSFQIAKPNCTDRCGNVSIPFPFGTTEGCYQSYSFWVTCNQTFDPPKTFLQKSSIEITDISLDGQLTLLQFIARDCYDENGTRVSNNRPSIRFPKYITVNNTANKFTVVGCNTYAFVSGWWLSRKYRTGCVAMCYAKEDLAPGSCKGLGCCQVPIPKQVRRVKLALSSFDNNSDVWDFNNCGYAFLVEESAFTFSPESLTTLRNVRKLPMVADWAIGNGTCEEARMNVSSYACKSVNSECYKPDNGYGYRCSCRKGYRGNPYILDGCQDINECDDPNNVCEKDCRNTLGGFECHCPKGYRGDGRKGGRGCVRGESLVFKLVAGIALGIIVVLLSAYWLHMKLKRRKLIKMRQKFFLQNGGLMLQEKLNRSDRSLDAAKNFKASELQKATNDFHHNMIIGQGGSGIVYKGFLPDNRIVAIKKSKEVDPNQIEQFINEVIILSQINHKNVVKLIGCCLETQVPLLVYEFVSNGTLFEHIQSKAKARSISWDMRLRIATETAGVLSYLHSATSTPIIHRDIKSANILLDNTYTAKVSDFGASKLVPSDQMQLSTMVQGTFGYLDPEYMQTNQLTEKSDVYSFGVVLVELLTGMKALNYNRPEEERNLAYLFLSVMNQGRLFQVLDDNVVREGNKEEVMKVAMLAKSCLKMRGIDRPSMKEVAMELEGLHIGGGKHSWVQTAEHNAKDMESLLGKGLSGFNNIAEGSSTSIGFDSLRDHVMLPEDGGR